MIEHQVLVTVSEKKLLINHRNNMRADSNVAVVSHAKYVPTLTAAAALRVKAALSKAAW